MILVNTRAWATFLLCSTHLALSPGHKKVPIVIQNIDMKLLRASIPVVFDSNGKRPSGMYSYLSSKCLDDSHYNQYDCEKDYNDWIFPVGRQLSIGSFAVCAYINW